MIPTQKCPFFDSEDNDEPCSKQLCGHFKIEYEERMYGGRDIYGYCSIDASDKQYDDIEHEPNMSWE